MVKTHHTYMIGDVHPTVDLRRTMIVALGDLRSQVILEYRSERL
jgi:hypothetical protein